MLMVSLDESKVASITIYHTNNYEKIIKNYRVPNIIIYYLPIQSHSLSSLA